MSADESPHGCDGVYIWGWSSNDRFQYPTATEGLRSYYYLPARKASLECMNRAYPGLPPPPYDERDEYHRKILLAATKILKSGKARRHSFAPDENEDNDWYTIKCTCRKTNDDGNVVYCMDCDTWQHMKCYYRDRVSFPALGVLVPRRTP